MPQNALARRQLLKAGLVGGVLSTTPAAAATATMAAAAPASETLTAHDVARVAAILYETSVPAADADKIAAAAGAMLANLHYLTLLRSEDVQPPFAYAAMVAEASRP